MGLLILVGRLWWPYQPVEKIHAVFIGHPIPPYPPQKKLINNSRTWDFVTNYWRKWSADPTTKISRDWAARWFGQIATKNGQPRSTWSIWSTMGPLTMLSEVFLNQSKCAQGSSCSVQAILYVFTSVPPDIAEADRPWLSNRIDHPFAHSSLVLFCWEGIWFAISK